MEFIESQQTGGLIWGCRHQAEASYDCLFYVNRETKLLSERHEPVTQHMCTRINNVFACLHILDAYQKKLLKIFHIEEVVDVAGHAGHHLVPDGSERRNSDMSEGETNICGSYFCMFFLFSVVVCVIYIDTRSQHPDIPGMV